MTFMEKVEIGGIFLLSSLTGLLADISTGETKCN